MIALHRLGHEHEFLLNPDHVVSVESTPDTVVTLVTGAKVLVTESPASVAELVLCWRAAILSRALEYAGPAPVPGQVRRVPRRGEVPLALVRSTAGTTIVAPQAKKPDPDGSAS